MHEILFDVGEIMPAGAITFYLIYKFAKSKHFYLSEAVSLI